MPSVRQGDRSAEPDPNTVDDSSPTSGLSGSTLDNESPPSEPHEIDSLLRTTEESTLSIREQLEGQCSLSPTAYYDDLRQDDSAVEQQRLIQAAEEEQIGSSMDNKGLSPTVFYETSSPQPEASAASLRSSISSLLSPFNPSTLSIAPNGELIRRPKRLEQTVTASTGNAPMLRHPFISGALDYDINRPPRSSSSSVLDFAITEHPAETGTHPKEETDRSITSSPSLAETSGSPSDSPPYARDTLRPLKRSRDETLLENKEGRLKRLRFENHIYALPTSSEPGNNWKKSFSTATTAVNSKPGSPSESTPIDYDRVVRIAIDSIENPVTITCHEHLILEVSGLHDSFCFKSKDNMITLYPEEKLPHIKAKTVEIFVHWLYHNRLTDPEGNESGFRQLLELYYLGQAYAMTVLRNVILDKLICRSVEYDIPSGCTKRMYDFTPSNDRLRRLWVDFYVWEVPEYQFLAEISSGTLHALFIRDLALAQMDRIRAMQMELTQGKPLSMTAPYLKAPSAYHMRDPITDACCRRDRFEGEGHFHRMDEHSQRVKYERENASLRATVEKFRMKFETIRVENIDLKRQLRKVQEKLELLICNVGSKVREHDFIDHRKLFWSSNFDYPEGSLLDSGDCNSHRTSMRGKLVNKLRV